MKLILIRHGETEANQKHLYCGHTDVPLTHEAKEQLKQNQQPKFQTQGMRIITSGAKRCEETAELLFPHAPREQTPAFLELNFGDFEMKSYEELKDTAEYQTWIKDDCKNKTPNGESGEDLENRVIKAINEIIKEDKDTILITHGGVIAVIMSHLFPDENKNRYEWQPPFCSGYEIDTENKTYLHI